MILFDFTQLEAAQRWFSVNDTVMGGMSRSNMVTSPLGYGLFSGHVSLANNGGFAAVRGEFDAIDVSEFHGIYLECEGEQEKRYKVNLKDMHTPEAIVYQAPLPKPRHQAIGVDMASVLSWHRIEIPFSDFLPRCRGQAIERDRLDLQRVCGVGLVIGAKQGGEFALKIKTIGCY